MPSIAWIHLSVCRKSSYLDHIQGFGADSRSFWKPNCAADGRRDQLRIESSSSFKGDMETFCWSPEGLVEIVPFPVFYCP